MSRPVLWELPVSYAAVGATQAVDLMQYPPRGYRPYEKSVRIGYGPARWDFAWHAVLSWGVKIRSGFTIEFADKPPQGADTSYTPVSFDAEGTPISAATIGADGDAVYGPDGMPFVTPGDSAWLLAPVGPFRFREPVRVVYVVDEPNRKGFAYGTLPGHPLSGEDAFFVDQADDGSVWLTVRSLSRPATGLWWLLYPALRIGQVIFRRRYLRALSGPTE
jgi:uncharacterized protein (UPF0548 family)